VRNIHSIVSAGARARNPSPSPSTSQERKKKEKEKETIQYETPDPAHPPFQKYPKQIIVLNTILAISET